MELSSQNIENKPFYLNIPGSNFDNCFPGDLVVRIFDSNVEGSEEGLESKDVINFSSTNKECRQFTANTNTTFWKAYAPEFFSLKLGTYKPFLTFLLNTQKDMFTMAKYLLKLHPAKIDFSMKCSFIAKPIDGEEPKLLPPAFVVKIKNNVTIDANKRKLVNQSESLISRGFIFRKHLPINICDILHNSFIHDANDQIIAEKKIKYFNLDGIKSLSEKLSKAHELILGFMTFAVTGCLGTEGKKITDFKNSNKFITYCTSIFAEHHWAAENLITVYKDPYSKIISPEDNELFQGELLDKSSNIINASLHLRESSLKIQELHQLMDIKIKPPILQEALPSPLSITLEKIGLICVIVLSTLNALWLFGALRGE